MSHRIGPYEVTREIGRGGMGVVSLWHDARLERDVAIKALPERLASDPARLERFEREAKTLATLNHPNVAGIYGLEEQDGSRYLILEYVEGDTLEQIIDRGPVPIEDAVAYAVGIASGLEAAHDAGVIHRDLKPANIKVTPGGVAKVLDFGLARLEQRSTLGESDEPELTATQPQHATTMEGAILGTPAYMSPEQARGRRIDKRTDIWSFGIVLYEMLSGRCPFQGETASDSLGAVLHKEFDLDELPSTVPAHVRRVLRRCLERDLHRRYRDIGDVRIELEPLDKQHAVEALPAARRTPVLLAVLLLLAFLALGVLGVRALAPPPATGMSAPMRVTLEPPPDARVLFTGDLAGPPVVSRDGARVAFSASRVGETRRLWLREMGDPEARELEGTDGALFPFWSPAGRYIGFFTGGAVKRYDTVSHTVERVCDAGQSRGGCWTEDGRIIFAPRFRGGLSIVDAEGGAPEVLTTLDEDRHTSHRWPFMIPGSDRFLFSAVTARAGDSDNNAIYLGRLDSEEPPTRVMASDYRAEFSDGHLLFVRDGALLARPLDLDEVSFTGDAKLIARDIAPDLSTWHGQFSSSPSGALIYNGLIPRSRDVNQAPRAYSWDMEGDRVTSFRYDGRVNTAYAVGIPMRTMSLSNDATMIALDSVGEDGFLDIWLHPTAFVADSEVEGIDAEVIRAAITDPEPRRLTFLPGAEVEPVWSPDGSEIAFRWDGDDTRPRGIYRKRIGDGVESLVYDNQGGDFYPADWTLDGEYIIAVSGTLLASPLNDIYAIAVESGERLALVEEPGVDICPQVSPDGRWLAYIRGGAGRSEVRVIPFAPAWPEHLRQRLWVVSDGSGTMPRWSREGDELFFIDGASNLVSLRLNSDSETFEFSTGRILFQAPWDTGRDYEPTPNRSDGENDFLFVDSVEDRDAPISVILGWQSLLDDD